MWSLGLFFSAQRGYGCTLAMDRSPLWTARRFRCGIKQTAALAGVGFLLQTSAVFAQGDSWLDWNVPPECPPASVIEARVAEWLGGPLREPEELAVQANLSWKQPSWHVTVDITYQGHHGQRQVIVSSCQDAADFVAVAVVLTVDPALAQHIPQASAATVETSSDGGKERAVGDTRIAPDPSPPIAPIEQETRAVVAAPRRAARIRGHVTLEAEGTYGPLPGLRPGAALGVGVDVGRHVLMLNARWLPGMDVAPAQAAAPISFGLLAGRLAWAYLPLRGDVSVGPLLSLSAGAIRTKQRPNAAQNQFWGAVGVGATVLYQIRPWIKLVAELEFEVPWIRPTFVLSDGSTVHQVSVGARGALGVRFFFPAQ